MDDATPSGPRNDAELYDPSNDTWVSTGSMHQAMQMQTTVPLADGRVLAIGGTGTSSTGAVAVADLYEPRDGSWTSVDPPEDSHLFSTATLLDDGSVLVVGGTDNFFNQPPTASVELYDPSSGRWRHCTAEDAHAGCPAPLSVPRVHQAAVLLADGRVLVAGGYGPGRTLPTGDLLLPSLSSAVIYDPATGRWSDAAPMNVARSNPEGALLTASKPCASRCDRALVVGGGNRSAELYDPATNAWAMTPVPRFDPGVAVDLSLPGALTELSDGRVALHGSGDGLLDLYDPVDNRWQPAHANPTNVTFNTTLLNTPACSRPGAPAFCGAMLEQSGSSSAIYHPTPVVRSLSASTGPSVGAAAVVITGTGFGGASRVKFGDLDATSFRVDSQSQITAVAPAQVSGQVEVSVRTPYGGTSQHFPADLTVPYTYTVSRPPQAVGDLAAKASAEDTVALSWSAPASDAADPPPAAKYIVKASRTPMDSDAAFDAAPSLCGGTCTFAPPAVGAGLSLSLAGLTAGTTYHFALRALNDAGQVGPRSNPASATTTGVAPATATPAVPPTPAAETVTPAATAPASVPPPPATTPRPSTEVGTVAPASLEATAAGPATTVPAPPVAAVAPTVAPSPERSGAGLPVLSAATHRPLLPFWAWMLLGLVGFAALATGGAKLNARLYWGP
jgi:hypothetical protein